MTFISTLFLSLFISLAAIPMFRGIAVRAHIMDMPDARKVHSHPIPKSGGPAMALGACVPVLFWLPLDPFVVSVLAGAVILVIAGLLDDIFIQGYKPKFLAQIIAALVVIIYGGIRFTTLGTLLPEGIELPFAVSVPLTLLVIVGITNAINLADGLDGLAGGITLIIFLCLCALAYRSGDMTVTIMSLAMLGALFGFLSFNTYPASVFMGDSGSQFLGFMSIVLSLKVTQGNPALSAALPLFIIGFPIIDTVLVMAERIKNGRSPFVADNNHLHHKLLSLGFFHTEAVFIIYLLQSVFVLAAYIFRFYSDWFILSLYFGLSGIIIMYFQLMRRYGITIKRYELIDKVIKGKLRFLKDEDNMLRISSLILFYLLPGLVIMNTVLAQGMPRYASIASFIIALMLILLWVSGNRMLGGMVRTVLYFMIPAIIYFGQEHPLTVSGHDVSLVYIGACVVCLLSAVVMVRLNRRQNSFRSSPMDFLILIIALCASPLLNSIMDIQQTRMFLVQILIFFYSYEILLNEQRKGKTIVIGTTIGVLLIIALKGVIL